MHRRRQTGGVSYPPESIKNHIKHAVYINLDSRTDRKAEIEEQLKIFNPEQVHRVPGVEDKEYPYFGCAKGHLNAIQLAVDNGWDNVLIMEDDAMWDSIDTAYPAFEKLIQHPYDVIMLGGTVSKFDPKTFKVESSKSAASYLINKSYYATVLEKAKDVIKNFKPGVTSDEDITPDMAVFYPLQASGSWFIVVPSLMIQRKGYSSILKKDTNYKELFA
jgi:GR25 family glycosyltransferase involved in LPS biosynthesis